jgi:hypothetical protein
LGKWEYRGDELLRGKAETDVVGAAHVTSAAIYGWAVVLKVPFAFSLSYDTNASDFSRDLSAIVYSRPGGNADLYLLSQK